jgi:hypothetical protein
MNKNYKECGEIMELINFIINNVSIWGETPETRDLRNRLESVAEVSFLRGIAEGMDRATTLTKENHS